MHPQAAQRKALDVLNSVGMGESVLRMIERRHRSDLYLALGGMVRHCLATRRAWLSLTACARSALVAALAHPSASLHWLPQSATVLLVVGLIWWAWR